MSGAGPDALGEVGGFRPGRWLLGRGWWFLPALLAVAVALPWVFGERWYSDTPYYQAIATQMVREGTWWSPMQGDLYYFNKPPLAFWVHAAFVAAFGQHDWSTHAPEAAFFVLACVLVAWLARRLHGPVVGVLAGCTMALTNEWIWRIGNFKLDALHTVLLFGAMACWVRAFVPDRGGTKPRQETRGDEVAWCIAAGLCIGAALMTKPFYGAGVGAIALAWMWPAGLLSVRRVGMVGVSVIVGVALAAPWHVAMVMTHGEAFVRAYLHEQTVQRALGEMHDSQPWYWYAQVIGGTVGEAQDPRKMWPIYGLALAGLVVVACRWKQRATRAGDGLAALWTLVWLIALSIFGGKRNYYLMVVHPGTAWLTAIALGWCLDQAIVVWSRSRIEAVQRALAVAATIACLALLTRVPHLVAKGHRELPVPERNEFMAFVRSQRALGREIYDCGITYRIDALAYIETGCWPRCISERTAFTPDRVPGGALMACRDEILAKGAFGTFVDPKDRLVFRSSPNGQYTVYERHTEAVQPATP